MSCVLWYCTAVKAPENIVPVMVSKESSGAVLMKLTAMYARMATEAVTKIALGMAMAQYLSCDRPCVTLWVEVWAPNTNYCVTGGDNCGHAVTL